MFYAPTTPADLTPLSDDAHEDYASFWSDFHKDAIGCRPRKAIPEDRMEAACEVNALSQWVAEEERINALAIEVARFRFSRTMEYLQRRGDASSPKEAFEQMCHVKNLVPGEDDWDYICYRFELPYGDAHKLKAFWEA